VIPAAIPPEEAAYNTTGRSPASSAASAVGAEAIVVPETTATSSGFNLSGNITAVPVSERIVAMTFDDGPHATLTPQLLDILKARNIKATFFVLGQCVANNPDITKRMVAEGHEVANHSWSHPLFTRLSDASVRSQLQRTHDIVKQVTGVDMQTMRPPYGGISSRQRKWIFDEFGYRTILWSVDPLDWKNRNSKLVTERILAGASSGGIILAHDIHATTVAAMPGTLDALIARGYQFVTVSDLLGKAHVASAPVAGSTLAASITADASR
jgi:peptidoglycan/xylan/chitin deacetylase (PgdA/CDA1 family)